MYTEFKAIVIGNELHLNKIAPHFGIQRKFKWEDPLLLKQDQLQGIVNNAAAERARPAGMTVVQNQCTMVEHRMLGKFKTARVLM